MGIEEKLPSGFMLTTVEAVAGYARKSSLWPVTFGLACCAIEMMASGAPRYDLARYGITVPKGWEQACKDKDHLSHQAWAVFYNYGAAAPFHTWTPSESEMEWLSAKYPDTFDKYYRPRYEHWAKEQKEGKRFYNTTLHAVPDLPDPDVLHRTR